MRRRTTTCCNSSLAFILKFLNFFQLFVGISIILYSVFMLNHWNKHFPVVPTVPPPSPSPDSSDSVTVRVSDLNFGAGMINGVFGGTTVVASSSSSPWFIYAFMGLGVTMCCISCMGHIAAAAINGCCLCFYALLKTVFILLEVAFILFIALDRHWERDLPSDPTKEIGRMREFVEANVDFCTWVGIAIVVIQGVGEGEGSLRKLLCVFLRRALASRIARTPFIPFVKNMTYAMRFPHFCWFISGTHKALSLLLAIVLRAIITSQMKDDENDIEKDSDVRGKAWEPLLNPRPTQPSVSVSGNGKAFHSDIWSSRMREKYGLSSGNGK